MAGDDPATAAHKLYIWVRRAWLPAELSADLASELVSKIPGLFSAYVSPFIVPQSIESKLLTEPNLDSLEETIVIPDPELIS